MAAIAAAMTPLTSTPALAATASIPAFGTATSEEEPVCARVRGAAACVGADESDRPGISIEDTEPDKLHATVEYYLNGYLGTKYVIHNLAGDGQIREVAKSARP